MFVGMDAMGYSPMEVIICLICYLIFFCLALSCIKVSQINTFAIQINYTISEIAIFAIKYIKKGKYAFTYLHTSYLLITFAGFIGCSNQNQNSMDTHFISWDKNIKQCNTLYHNQYIYLYKTRE